MSIVFTEENGMYEMDCTKAVWAAGDIKRQYNQAGISHLNDADFVIETDRDILIVEYKNSAIPDATAPQDFQTLIKNNFDKLVRKFYDTLHYLTITRKEKPKRYICVIEAPGSELVMRLRLRDRLARELPFLLQAQLNTGVRLIEGVDVLSIEEWNRHERYRDYPLREKRKDVGDHTPQDSEAVEDALCPAGS